MPNITTYHAPLCMDHFRRFSFIIAFLGLNSIFKKSYDGMLETVANFY
ncbi:hypothetical protein BSU04_01870 [Caballeronia sordidicola]|uniref:Uncharacterized protein n=1 Tax=Caballeronia sordidicola TaxID=196367 RepID=A0A226XAA5_CABSO|nr:hypothetical protein BSU04_01870 [Caballeronia sordidicola]